MSEIIEDNLVENDSIGTENNPYLISDKESLQCKVVVYRYMKNYM